MPPSVSLHLTVQRTRLGLPLIALDAAREPGSWRRPATLARSSARSAGTCRYRGAQHAPQHRAHLNMSLRPSGSAVPCRIGGGALLDVDDERRQRARARVVEFPAASPARDRWRRCGRERWRSIAASPSRFDNARLHRRCARGIHRRATSSRRRGSGGSVGGGAATGASCTVTMAPAPTAHGWRLPRRTPRRHGSDDDE
jgi:hypothetical protein